MEERLPLGAMLFMVLVPLAVVCLAQRAQLSELIAPDALMARLNVADEQAQVVALGHDLIVARAR